MKLNQDDGKWLAHDILRQERYSDCNDLGAKDEEEDPKLHGGGTWRGGVSCSSQQKKMEKLRESSMCRQPRGG